MPAAVCFGGIVRVRISAAAFGAVGAELRVAAHVSRESLFLYVATSMLIMDFDTADYFDHTRFYAEPHRWTIAMQDEAFSWLDEKLSHRR